MTRVSPVSIWVTLRHGLRLAGCAAVAGLWAAATAHATCGDSPGPGVDWAGCAKQQLMLEGKDLSGANFSGAFLSGASLQGTNLQGTNFSGSELPRAAFVEANLAGANFEKALASRADFQTPISPRPICSRPSSRG